MESQIIAVILCILSFGHCAVDTILLDVNPPDIVPGFTELLNVNCSFNHGAESEISALLALSISRSEVQNNRTPTWVELVSLNSFAADQVSVLSEIYNAFSSGHVAASDDAYLSLVWRYPLGIESGLYRCEARGLNKTGHFVTVLTTTQLTTHKPTVDELIKKVIEVQSDLDRKHSIESCDSLQAELEQLKQNHTVTVSTLQKALEQEKKDCNETVYTLKTELEHLKKITRSQQGCGTNKFYISENYNNRSYLLSKYLWNDTFVAEADCEACGGYLAEIDDSAEYAFIKSFLNQFDIPVVLLGGTDEAQEGHWRFLFSGRPVVFTDWMSGSPGYHDQWDCQAIFRNLQWQMYDHSCKFIASVYKEYFLCEVPEF